MKKLLLSGLASAGLLSLACMSLASTGYAHGGQYRGPGDVVPPATGGGGRTPGPSGPSTPGPSGPSTPGPAGPSTPGPSGPATGGPAAPAAGAGPTTGPRGAPIGPDLSKWEFWWEFNKDPFIRLKDAIHSDKPVSGGDEFFMGGTKRAEGRDTMKPTEGEILNTILPAIKRALDSTDDRDITSSCLIAMAKIGKDHDNFEILPIMKERLKSNDQEIRETAALSMGISQMTKAVPDLVELAKDSAKGRELCGRSQVDYRTRTFALYGLGLVAYATNDADVKRQAFEVARDLVKDYKKITDRNIKVAAVNAIRLVRPDAKGGDKHAKLLGECLDTLEWYYKEKTGQGEQQIQAHCLPAIAQLLGRGGDEDGKYKDAFARELSGKVKRNINMYQSAAIALGVLCQPAEVEKKDAKYAKILRDYFDKGRDLQTRYFSLMSLAKIGGDYSRNELLKVLKTGKKALEKPWAAVSLGVLAHNKMEAAKKSGAGAELDETVGRELHREFNNNKTPSTKAAIAIGLGLTKYKISSDDIQDTLLRYKSQDDLAGYLCIGLALMGADRATEDIRNIVKTSIRRPDLLKQAAIALGKMGDKKVANDLQEMLKDDSRNVAKLSAIASALGFIGDRRSIDPLKKLLFDSSVTELSRAFAAVALGGVADKEPLPWNSKIAVDMNYRAAVETLTNGVAGILDIL